MARIPMEGSQRAAEAEADRVVEAERAEQKRQDAQARDRSARVNAQADQSATQSATGRKE